MIRQPHGDLHLYGGAYVKEMRVPDAGTVIPQHAHQFDHLSYLARGAVDVWADGKPIGRFHAPAAIRIPARVKHLFRSLVADTLVLCIHAVGEAEATFNEDDLVHERHEIAEGA